jgi:general secretion pathway protein L
MAQLAAGIDIGDDLLSAVLVSGTGRDAQVLACAQHFFRSAADLAEELPLLLEKLGGGKADHCAVGISLSCLSLRNLTLPFTDEKKVRQVLPFELEEQLLQPAEELIITTALAAAAAGGTSLIAAAAEKGLLLYQLEAFRKAGLEADSISPAVHALADRLCRTKHTGDKFLLLHGDLSGIQLVLAWQGEIIFMRRLSWPDDVFTQALFVYQEDGGLSMTEPEAAEEAVRSICAQILRSLEYFAFHNSKETAQPDYFVLTGPAQLCPELLAKMEAALELPGRTCDLVRDGAASLSKAAAGTWQAALHDKALALALQQAGRRSKESGLNFRQGELAPPRHLLGSRKQLTVLAAAAGLALLLGCGWLITDQQRLKKQQADLAGKIEQLFKESFPGVTPGPDPYIHMKSRLKSVDSSAGAMPLFTDEKRVLAILADISARIPASIQLQVKQLVIDQDSVIIKGSTDTFNSVYTMQSLLSNSDRYAGADIASSVKGKNDEGILFDIRLKLKTESGS